jgi:hypothetical protein
MGVIFGNGLHFGLGMATSGWASYEFVWLEH